MQALIEENLDGESLLSNLDDCLEQVLKNTSIEGRTHLKHLFTETQTRWSNYQLKQKQIKQSLHHVKMDRLELEETLTDIEHWINEQHGKLNDLIHHLSLRDENRKRLYQLKCLANEINVKESLLNTLKEKSSTNDKLHRIEQNLHQFHDDLKHKHLFLEEFLRIQNSIEDSKQSIMEKLKFLMDRLSLCTKTDCDLDTLQSRLKKIEVSFSFDCFFFIAHRRLLGISK